MRVLMTTDTIGGVWTFSRELSLGLLENGSSVTLVSLGRLPNPEQQRWASKMQNRWPHTFAFYETDNPLEWMDNNAACYIDAEAELVNLAQASGAEILHSNQFCFGSLPLDIPIVITAHSDVLSWAQACGRAPLVDSDWLRHYNFVVSSGLANADAITSPTAWMMDTLGSYFRLPAQQRVIPNGRTIVPPRPGAKLLQAVTSGRLWDPAKGLHHLTDLRTTMPIHIAGEQDLDALTSVPTHFHCHGSLPESELISLFSRSAIYVCPSLYEPFGLAPLEAALCGCAVLANDISPLREVWGDAALYFSGRQSLEDLLGRLSDDPDWLARVQTNSMQRARTYTHEKMTAAYIDFFERTIDTYQGHADAA